MVGVGGARTTLLGPSLPYCDLEYQTSSTLCCSYHYKLQGFNISWLLGAIFRSLFSQSSTMAAFGVSSTVHEVVQAFRTHLAVKISIVILSAITDYLFTIPILITGPNKDGIGAEIAKMLASGDPDHLLLAGRN